jgi:formate hydrogenlyase subunit 3/multisubunit Na+/H+ antiporter MnhD subunit
LYSIRCQTKTFNIQLLPSQLHVNPHSLSNVVHLKCSVIQFCATAFGYYAQATAAQEIFGHTLQSLRGIKYLYKYNVFQIGFVILAGLTFLYYIAFGWRRKKTSGRFQLSS